MKCDRGNYYAISREKAGKGQDLGWRVELRRHGQLIFRPFPDSAYGSREASLAQARAFRDAVLAAIPPRTNHEAMVQLQRNNQSGVSGVCRVNEKSGPAWVATLITLQGRKVKRFWIDEYGDDRAKALAIAQRRKWLKESPVNYMTLTQPAEAAALKHFAEQLDPAPDVYPYESLSKAEVEARLAVIHAQFNAQRPPRLIVRGRCYRTGILTVYISDVGRPVRRAQIDIGTRRSTEMALTKAHQKIVATITEFYNSAAARWFMEEHGQHLLAPASFDPEEGFSVLVFVPVDLLS